MEELINSAESLRFWLISINVTIWFATIVIIMALGNIYQEIKKITK